jgi:enoyl-CoA hydratase/carnithine racemase
MVGKNLAREIFMTSDPYSAGEALRMGLVDRVHRKDAFLPEVVGFAERVATHQLTP